ncbi:hypothetical protein KJ891_02100, partial [Candidatus Micrarchaeota archaeon]|nr:hypothetical protein [Candidatus Micrarchaeota archaeon]
MVFGSNTGAKLLFVLAAVFALMPFVSANMSGPEPILAIPAIALFLFMSNAGFNLLAILAVQKLFLGSFFEKLKPRRIIAILAGVTLLGFFSDFIGFTVTTWLGNNVAELYYGSMPLLNAAIMYFIISFAIFLLDLIFLAVVIRMPKKQA